MATRGHHPGSEEDLMILGPIHPQDLLGVPGDHTDQEIIEIQGTTDPTETTCHEEKIKGERNG